MLQLVAVAKASAVEARIGSETGLRLNKVIHSGLKQLLFSWLCIVSYSIREN